MDAVTEAPTRNAPARSVIDAWLGRLYPQAFKGQPVRDLFGAYCRFLADHSGAALVTLSQAAPGGNLTMLAQSAETSLWAELHKVPERRDECLTGNAAAGSALRQNHPVAMDVADERLLVWRSGLERARIASVLAFPFCVQEEQYVLQVYLADRVTDPEAMGLEPAIERLAEFAANLHALDHDRLLASALESAGNAAFLTDLEGTIVWANRAFTRLSGYSNEETVGRNPRFLSSGQQSVRYYRELWSTIRSGRVWMGETVDHDREGHPYTILQTVSPVATSRRITHYLSIHDDITQAQQKRRDLECSQQVEPETGLLLPAAFERAAEEMLATGPDRGVLALLHSQTLASAGSEARALMGRRLAASLPGAALACSRRPGEYLVLLADEGEVAALARAGHAAASLRTAIDGVAAPDLLLFHAAFPAEGRDLTALRLLVERRAAVDPLPRARRQLAH